MVFPVLAEVMSLAYHADEPVAKWSLRSDLWIEALSDHAGFEIQQSVAQGFTIDGLFRCFRCGQHAVGKRPSGCGYG